jgi:hypothetical protein
MKTTKKKGADSNKYINGIQNKSEETGNRELNCNIAEWLKMNKRYRNRVQCPGTHADIIKQSGLTTLTCADVRMWRNQSVRSDSANIGLDWIYRSSRYRHFGLHWCGPMSDRTDHNAWTNNQTDGSIVKTRLECWSVRWRSMEDGTS